VYRYNQDDTYRKQRLDLLKTKVRNFFQGHGVFERTIMSYYPRSDTYHIPFDDGDHELDSYANIQKYIPGTPEYLTANGNSLALSVALEAAVTGAASLNPQNLKEPDHYKDAMRAPDAPNGAQHATLRRRNSVTSTAGQSSNDPTFLQAPRSWAAAGYSGTSG
jgi:hypothetical protein